MRTPFWRMHSFMCTVGKYCTDLSGMDLEGGNQALCAPPGLCGRSLNTAVCKRTGCEKTESHEKNRKQKAVKKGMKNRKQKAVKKQKAMKKRESDVR